MHGFHDDAILIFYLYAVCPPVNTTGTSSSTQIWANSVIVKAESKEDSADGGAKSTTDPIKRTIGSAPNIEVTIKLVPGVVPVPSFVVTIKSEPGMAPPEPKDDTSAGVIELIVTRKRLGEVAITTSSLWMWVWS